MAWFGEGGEIYQMLTFGVVWKKKKLPNDLRWLNVLQINGNTWRVGKSTKYSLLAYFEKKASQKPIFFFKTAKKLHTGNTWLDSGGKGGSLPNIHLWRILKKKETPQKPRKDLKWLNVLRKMATLGGWGNLPNTHFWHILKRKPPKAHIFFQNG